MKSRGHQYKQEVLDLRRQGVSMTVIERKYGIARSTLSGWFKEVPLTEEQRTRLMKNSLDGWARGRPKAALWHRTQKQKRLEEAKIQALDTLQKIELTPEILDLAFAMLYWGEGAKNGGTSLASSDPRILRFVLAVLENNYDLSRKDIRCELHLRMDQESDEIKNYWSKELGVPLERFKHIAYDKRTAGRPTYPHYKGVCVLQCGKVAIQRKLIYLYTLFCDKVSGVSKGV